MAQDLTFRRILERAFCISLAALLDTGCSPAEKPQNNEVAASKQRHISFTDLRFDIPSDKIIDMRMVPERIKELSGTKVAIKG